MLKYLFLTIVPLLLSMDQADVRQGQDYALFIAVDNYQEWPDLRNPVSDARAVARELEEHYAFATDILVNPTRSEIYAALDTYGRRTYGGDDQLFIFFSGHGDFNERTAEGFFVPREGQLDDPFQDSYIPHTRLERIIDNIPCPHILLAIDACYSGTFDAAIAMQRGRPGQRPGTDTNDDHRQWFISRQLKYQSRLYLTSGGKERTPDGDRYSPFTGRFLEALRSYGLDDGILSFAELTGFMQLVEPLPRYGSFGSHEPGGDFLMITELEPTAPTRIVSPPRQASTPNASATPNTSGIPDDWESSNLTNPSTSSTHIRAASGNEYAMLRISGQNWLSANLREDRGRNSDCYDSSSLCNQYGRLYTWEEAKRACSSLGTGWRLPTLEDWRQLTAPFGGTEDTGKDYGTAAYNALKQGGPTGFNAQLGGYWGRGYGYDQVNEYGCYWTSSQVEGNTVAIIFSGNQAIYERWRDPQQKLSCRCVKD